ncbi:hypothetical protein SKAU_G00175050 [Synaphobranchus kaupii]|uniref:H15 domain-containing protein n=1 Tax=Synaphobranchus kaupii TaxID=118154 RepID=A0A9Q1FLR4_SYNKA|nr:hypothetical protein SKAU_G00175050 [Synaphobranchus kaupii]
MTDGRVGSMTLLRSQLAMGLVYLSWNLCASAAVLEKIELDDQMRVTCDQGLTDCRVKDEVIQSPDSGYVYVRELDGRAFLCCRRGRDCRPCLRIQTHITFNGPQDDRELSGNDDDDEEAQEEAGFVSLCCNIPNGLPVCKRLEFRLPPAALEEHHNREARFSLSLLVSDMVYFGSLVLVSAQNLNQTILIPSERDVCSSALWPYVECNVPTLRTAIDQEKKVALLQLDKDDINSTSPVEICQKYGEAGECRYQQWNGTNISIPLDSVVSCLCFQVRRRGGGLAWKTCPFRSSNEFLERTWERVQNCGCARWEGGGVGQDCREVEGSRQQVENGTSGGWQRDSPGPLASRRRWVFPFVLSTVMICAAVLGACRLHSILKSWVSRWCKDDGLRGAVRRRQVVLLSPPDLDPTLAVLVSRLGTALCSLGFGVTADLWSRAELGALGPVPWLHGQLDQLGREGGQVVLILTRAAWERSLPFLMELTGQSSLGLWPASRVLDRALRGHVPDQEQLSTDVPKKGGKHSEKLDAVSGEPSKVAVMRKVSTHPSTMEMVKEALKELDTRKGSSAQAIRGYILEKGDFDLLFGEKTKGPKGTENSDPNAEKPSVKAKGTGTEKPKPVAKRLKNEDSGATKAVASKVAPAKKPKKAAGAGAKEVVAKPKVGDWAKDTQDQISSQSAGGRRWSCC